MSRENNNIEIEHDLERFLALHQLTLDEVKAMPPAELLKMDGFGYRLLNYLFNPNNTKGINGILND